MVQVLGIKPSLRPAEMCDEGIVSRGAREITRENIQYENSSVAVWNVFL
jgi:hypothetical protein